MRDTPRRLDDDLALSGLELETHSAVAGPLDSRSLQLDAIYEDAYIGTEPGTAQHDGTEDRLEPSIDPDAVACRCQYLHGYVMTVGRPRDDAVSSGRQALERDAAIGGCTCRHGAATTADPLESNVGAGHPRQHGDRGVLRRDDPLGRGFRRRRSLRSELLGGYPDRPRQQDRGSPERRDGRLQDAGGSAARRNPTRLSFVVGGSHCRYVDRHVVGFALNRPPRTITESRSAAFAL